MELLDVEFGTFPHPAPKNRPAELMHLEHMLLRFFARQTKDLLENHRDIAHQVNRIVVHDDLPGEIDFFRGASLLLDHGIFY